MIPGDIGAELVGLLQDAVAEGELPASAAGLTAAGTWRPAPADSGGGAGTYATSLPFALARLAGRDPGPLAALLAARLAAVAWISAARVTGSGYLTITVATSHLTGLAARITAAGKAAAASDALAGTDLTSPSLPDLAAELTWERAWRSQRDALVGRLADAAGAGVLFIDSQRKPAPTSTTQAGHGPVPAAVAQYGADAVRYALARTASGVARAIERQLGLPEDLANPFVAVRYAHADAASTLRWAADLGMTVAAPPRGSPHDTHPSELVLLDAMSWLPERTAAAARRRRPAELAAYLEYLAGAWLDCRENCPALPFCGQRAPADPAGAQAAARLELADAARIVLLAGLTVLGVSAPRRL